jgi:hypothetical protein
MSHMPRLLHSTSFYHSFLYHLVIPLRLSADILRLLPGTMVPQLLHYSQVSKAVPLRHACAKGERQYIAPNHS